MIVNQDILKWCKDREWEPQLPKFHAVLCDPPYELGFMGKTWDKSGIAFDPKTWRKLADQCYPGAYLLAFGGTRTFHRIAVAIEDAGFEIRDTVMWVYGSGFPKSLDVSKAIDKAAGAEREVVGRLPHNRPSTRFAGEQGDGEFVVGSGEENFGPITAPSTPAAKQWQGYGTALKPAWEPVIIARLPLEGTVAENCQKYGSGSLNIDGTRVGTTKDVPASGRTKPRDDGWGMKGDETTDGFNKNVGRFPANLIHDGSDEVVGMFPTSKSGSVHGVYGHKEGFAQGDVEQHHEASSGSAARFFKSVPPDKKSMWMNHGEADGTGVPQGPTYDDNGSAARFFYSAKVSKRERDAGLEGFEEKKSELNSGGIGREISVDKRLADGEGINAPMARNVHPTVKPISLTTYLAKLILPPKLDKPRRLLVPFAGSGSEVIGGYLAGWDEVVGVEQSEEYCKIAEARVKHWNDQE